MSPHGTVARYRRGGCRCDPCKKANRDRYYQVKADLLQRPRSEVPHGTPGGYVNWGCRCVECSEARSSAQRAKWAERRDRRQAG